MARIETEEQLRSLIGSANRLTRAKIRDHLDEQARSFIQRSPLLLIATVCDDGSVEVSPKGDKDAVAFAEDARTLLLPERDGNKLAFGLANIVRNPNVGLIFLSPRDG